MASDGINTTNTLPPLVTQPVTVRPEGMSSREGAGAAANTAASARTEAVSRAEPINNTERAEKARDSRTAEQKSEQLHDAVDKINEVMLETRRSLSFSVDEETSQVVVKVMNTKTDEIIRQIPNEEALEFAKHLESMMGLIFNDKA